MQKRSYIAATSNRDVDVTVGGREDAGWNAGRVVVASGDRHLAVLQIARGLEVQHLDLRLQQARWSPTGPRPEVSRSSSASRMPWAQNMPAREVGDGDAGAHQGLAADQAGDRHDAAHALGDSGRSRGGRDRGRPRRSHEIEPRMMPGFTLARLS